MYMLVLKTALISFFHISQIYFFSNKDHHLLDHVEYFLGPIEPHIVVGDGHRLQIHSLDTNNMYSDNWNIFSNCQWPEKWPSWHSWNSYLVARSCSAILGERSLLHVKISKSQGVQWSWQVRYFICADTHQWATAGTPWSYSRAIWI